MKTVVNTFLAFSFVALAACQDASTTCRTIFLGTLAAGEFAQASVWSPIGHRCQATLSFSDDNFLPVHFDTEPNTCPGAQRMELTIPNEVPIGEAFLSWLCAGDTATSCSRVKLVGGQSDSVGLALAQTASLVCDVSVTTSGSTTTSTTSPTTSGSATTTSTRSGSTTRSGSATTLATSTRSGSTTTITTRPTTSGSATSPPVDTTATVAVVPVTSSSIRPSQWCPC